MSTMTLRLQKPLRQRIQDYIRRLSGPSASDEQTMMPLAKSDVVVASSSWWLAGGIAEADVAGVWQPKGAASLAASYLRLAGDEGYSSVDPAITGIGTPDWSAERGWICDAFTGKILSVGISTVLPRTMILRIANCGNPSPYQSATGAAETNSIFRIKPIGLSPNHHRYYCADVNSLVAGWFPSGVVALCADLGSNNVRGYKNGVVDGLPRTASINNSGGTFYVGGTWNTTPPGGQNGTLFGDVLAVAFYKRKLNDAENLALYTAMMAL